jgi:hypothetical protein
MKASCQSLKKWGGSAVHAIVRNPCIAGVVDGCLGARLPLLLAMSASPAILAFL